MFAPQTPIEIHQFLFTCLTRTAEIKGFKNAEFYFFDDLLAFLKTHHPDTFNLFSEFKDAYEKWASLSRESDNTNSQAGKILKTAFQESYVNAAAKRDQTRTALLTHLGLGA
jgi:hypothetical protein